MYTIQDVQTHQQRALKTYFSYHDNSVGQIQTLTQIQAVVYPLNHSAPQHFTVNADSPLGPFNNTGIAEERAYFDSIKEVHFHYQFNNTHQSYMYTSGKVQTMRYTWDITAVYDFSIDIVAKYQIHYVSRPTSQQIIGSELSIIDGCTLGLCIFSIFL